VNIPGVFGAEVALEGYVALDIGVRGFHNSPVKRSLAVALGVLMVVVGAVWTFQGLGYLGGSAMTDVAVWAVIGPVVAGFGVALAFVGLRR
jgi:hypothetical protein